MGHLLSFLLGLRPCGSMWNRIQTIHRIIESFGSEGTPKGPEALAGRCDPGQPHFPPPPCLWAQGSCSRAVGLAVAMPPDAGPRLPCLSPGWSPWVSRDTQSTALWSLSARRNYWSNCPGSGFTVSVRAVHGVSSPGSAGSPLSTPGVGDAGTLAMQTPAAPLPC